MSYEMNFEIRMNTGKQAKAVLPVAKKALVEIGFSECADNLETSGSYVLETTCCSFFGENFGETVKSIYTAIVKELQDIDFEIFSGYTWGTEEAGHHFIKRGSYAKADGVMYEGWGLCPECGKYIVHVDDYDPSETYYCEECGTEINNNEMFGYFEKYEHIYEVVNGELIEK